MALGVVWGDYGLRVEIKDGWVVESVGEQAEVRHWEVGAVGAAPQCLCFVSLQLCPACSLGPHAAEDGCAAGHRKAVNFLKTL